MDAERCEEVREPDLPRGQIASCVHRSYRPDVDADPGESRSRAAGLVLRRALLNGCYCSDPRPRGSARWAHARRDRSVTAARAERKCSRRAESSSVATQHRPQTPCRRPCLLDECALRGCRLLPETRPRIGNRFGNLQGYRQRNSPNNGISACFAQTPTRPARLPTRPDLPIPLSRIPPVKR